MQPLQTVISLVSSFTLIGNRILRECGVLKRQKNFSLKNVSILEFLRMNQLIRLKSFLPLYNETDLIYALRIVILDTSFFVFYQRYFSRYALQRKVLSSDELTRSFDLAATLIWVVLLRVPQHHRR